MKYIRKKEQRAPTIQDSSYKIVTKGPRNQSLEGSMGYDKGPSITRTPHQTSRHSVIIIPQRTQRSLMSGWRRNSLSCTGVPVLGQQETKHLKEVIPDGALQPHNSRE